MILTLLVIGLLVGLIVWGVPKIPQPWQWIVIAVIVVVAAIMLFQMLPGVHWRLN